MDTKPTSKTKTHLLQVRCTEQQKLAVDTIASRLGITTTAFVLKCIRSEIDRIKAKANQKEGA